MVTLALIPYLALSAAIDPLVPIIAEQLHMSAQAMSLARRTGSDRVLPWEQLGQSGVAVPVAERSPVTVPPIVQPRRMSPPVYPRRSGRGTYRGGRGGVPRRRVRR